MDKVRQAIEFAFEKDSDILNYCDPDYKDKSLKELTDSIYDKIIGCSISYTDCAFYRYEVDGLFVGFFFLIRDPNVLVSFGINKDYRNKETLSHFFEVIKDEFDENGFDCYMWERNVRGNNWLQKCGMEKQDCEIPNCFKFKM